MRMMMALAFGVGLFLVSISTSAADPYQCTKECGDKANSCLKDCEDTYCGGNISSCSKDEKKAMQWDVCQAGCRERSNRCRTRCLDPQ
jgi:hypothetical protein